MVTFLIYLTPKIINFHIPSKGNTPALEFIHYPCLGQRTSAKSKEMAEIFRLALSADIKNWKQNENWRGAKPLKPPKPIQDGVRGSWGYESDEAWWLSVQKGEHCTASPMTANLLMAAGVEKGQGQDQQGLQRTMRDFGTERERELRSEHFNSAKVTLNHSKLNLCNKNSSTNPPPRSPFQSTPCTNTHTPTQLPLIGWGLGAGKAFNCLWLSCSPFSCFFF